MRGRDARIAAALLVAKMLHPSSEREASVVAGGQRGEELVDLDRGKAPLEALPDGGCASVRCRRGCSVGSGLLELPDTIVFYDLTNTWYTGRSDQELLRFGRSKEGPPAGDAGAVAGWCGIPAGVRGFGGGLSEPDASGGAQAIRGGGRRGRQAEADGDPGRGDRDGGEHRLDSGLWLDLREPGDAAGAAGGGGGRHVDGARQEGWRGSWTRTRGRCGWLR